MDTHHDAPAPETPPAIRGRSDTGGPWSVAWPLAALAIIGLLTVRACVPGLPAGSTPATATTSTSGR